jgi:hypothetical protein
MARLTDDEAGWLAAEAERREVSEGEVLRIALDGLRRAGSNR